MSNPDEIPAGLLRRYVPADERVVISLKPHPLFILLAPLGRIVLICVVALVGRWLGSALELGISLGWLRPAAAFVIVGILAWHVLEWMTRLYVLTERRVIRVAGVLRQHAADLPLDSIQHVTVFCSIRERLFGLGTLAFSTPGTAWPEAAWVMVDRPQEHLVRLRQALDGRVGSGADEEKPIASPLRLSRPIVIGIAGGIGSGKSAVASEFGRLGCVVIDSDIEARAAFDRPMVRETLVAWWGDRVVDAHGEIDRMAVSSIVFDDADQRRRLERLIHPIVRESRHTAIERAAREGVAAVVVDSPLLFEAGIDRECDTVVFVHAASDVRLERVRSTRSWTEEELLRRENAQMALEEKRQKSDHEVVNDAGRERLAGRVAEVFSQIRQTHTGTG